MGWQLELVGGSSSFVDDLERSNLFVVELLLGMREVKVGGIEPYPISYTIVSSSAFLLVVLHLHSVGGFN